MTDSTQALLEHRQITREQLDLAARLKAKRGGTIGYHLIGVGAIDNDVLADFFAGLFSLRKWDRPEMQEIADSVVKRISEKLAGEYRILPLAIDGETLTLGMTDPGQNEAIEETALHTGCTVKPAVVSEKDMTWALETYYGLAPSMRDYEDSDSPPRAAEARTTVKRGSAKKAYYVPPEDPMGPSEFPSHPPPRYPQDTHGVKVRAPMRLTEPPPPARGRSSLVPEPVRHEKKTDANAAMGLLVAAIHKAPNRNAIVDLALQYLLLFSERAAFFVVKRDKIQGFDIVGPLTSRTAMRSFWAPLSTSSTLSRLAEDKAIHLGPLGRSPADAILAAALGGRPARVLAIPVVIGKRVAGILYADKLQENLPTYNSLKRLGEVVGENFARLLTARPPK